MDEGTFNTTFHIAIRNFLQDNPGKPIGSAKLVRDVWEIKAQEPGTVIVASGGSMHTLADAAEGWKAVRTREELFALIGRGCNFKREGSDERVGWTDVWRALDKNGHSVAKLHGDPWSLPA